ncbi:unnamed protein product [Ostreobium quekettii]|uniref:Uncharacterized protein n=1 Tax=Ostreobium quekettii TaxID=121088 RepID=A0A8S1IXS6_9CHLO|nr:unnamed protein product [Ostreobium quekettii]|eukprot:evm.model.scf_312.6 EVM.evm.TU.scf_312.6   scf_312:62216-63833(-)
MEYVTPEGLRTDGRRPRELRKLGCQLGTLESADGSATCEMGFTKVLAAVFGPRDTAGKLHPDRAVVRCQVATAPFSAGERRRRGKRGPLATEQAATIRETLAENIHLELLPRTQIDLYFHVLQADGGILSTCLNAGMLALADAGIPLKDLVGSCTVGYLESTPLLDLNYIEESGGGPLLPMAYQPNMDKILMLQMDKGKLPVETFEVLATLATEGCRAVTGQIRQSLMNHTKQLAVARGSV